MANYAGVTVERKAGTARLPDGRSVTVIDLPGAYSLDPATPDEQVMLEVIEGRRAGERAPDLIVAVVDATNLRMNLRLVLELQRLGRPMLVALNMADVARAQGLAIDRPRWPQELGCAVVETVAVRHNGHAQLLQAMQSELGDAGRRCRAVPRHGAASPAAAAAAGAAHPGRGGAARRCRRGASTRASTRWSCTRCGACCCWRRCCS